MGRERQIDGNRKQTARPSNARRHRIPSRKLHVNGRLVTERFQRRRVLYANTRREIHVGRVEAALAESTTRAGAVCRLRCVPRTCASRRRNHRARNRRNKRKSTSLIYPHANVILGNALDHDRENYYDVVIGNPPFGESVSTEREFTTLTKRKGVYAGKSENAFIELAIRAAKPGGWITFILPMGIDFRQDAAKIRRLMYDTCWHFATIKLPPETFQHVGTSIPTQILIMRKVPPGTPRIKSPHTKMRSLDGRLIDYEAEFFAGQPPIYMAEVTDIGYDKHGKSTDKWGDGLTQLDEIADDLTWDDLVAAEFVSARTDVG